ncbi:MAG: methyltransferase domain-containing protein [Roseiflexaceae bacterium]
MRRLSAQPLDQEITRMYLRTFPSKQLFINPHALPDIDSRHLFGDDQPLHLEVGCGTADYLRALAHDDPRTNFVGIDLAQKPLLQAISLAAAQALPNIRFIRGDFKLMYPLLVVGSLKAVSVHFPDPHMQPRFHKRRIVTPAFLDAIYRALAPDGQLSIMTDHQALFRDILTLVERDTRFGRAHEEQYLIGFEPTMKSRFQRLWEGHGLPTLRLDLRTQRALEFCGVP